MTAAIWLALRAIGGKIAAVGGKLIDWLLRDFRHVAIAVLIALAAWQAWHAHRLTFERDVARGAVEILADRAVSEKHAHLRTKQTYRDAQAEAARLDRKRLERVRAAQQEISNEVLADYRRRLGDARVRAERLREQLVRAGERADGTPGREPVPAAGASAGGAAAAARDPGLPARDPRDQLERDLVATEQAHQLDALIDWVIGQSEIDPNRP